MAGRCLHCKLLEAIMNYMSFSTSKINPMVPLGETHGTIANARLHREEMVEVANEIADKKL